MEFEPHPLQPAWLVGGEVDTRDPPPECDEDGLRALYGMAPGDWDPRLFLVPNDTPHFELIEFFEVGTWHSVRHGWDERDTIDLVINTITQIDAIVPGSIEMATPTELRFRFWRRMRIDELEDIEAVYKKVDDYQAGLELYINSLSGASILHDVQQDGLLRLTWS